MQLPENKKGMVKKVAENEEKKEYLEEEKTAAGAGESIAGQNEPEDAGAADVAEEAAGGAKEAEDGSASETSDMDEEPENPDGETSDDAAKSKEGKGFFKKKEKKEKKDPRDEKIEELSDKVLRQMAEFENFRKRTEKEKSQMFEIGARSILEKLLPVIDNFERGLASVSEEEKENAFVQGMDKTYRQLLTELSEAGVTPIEAVGQEFNPDFHNAVMHIEDENFGENIVAEEFQKGYMYKDVVVRHSMVKVAN